MGDATRNLSQRKEMTKWLAKLSPELGNTFEKMYKSFEDAEAAGGETEAAMDAAEDKLIQTAKEAAEKSSASGSAQKSLPTKAKAASSGATLVIDEFAFGKPDVPAIHKSKIEELRKRLAATTGSTVTLVGHTDTVDTERFNKKLGLERAAAVRAMLTAEKGVSAAQFKLDSGGETQPAAGQPPAKLDPDKGVKNPKNRRVEVFVTWAKGPSVSTKPAQPGPKATPTPPVKPPEAAPTKTTEKEGGRGGLTFDYQWDSKEFGSWNLTYVKGSFKVKVKLKGELLQKGSGWKITEGYTANKGVKAVLELGKQKAVEIFSSLTLKEVTESFEDEVSAKKVEVKFQIKATLQTGVSWLSPMLTGSFVIASIDWEKLKKDPTSGVTVVAINFGAGVQAKGKFDINNDWEFNGSAEFTAEGSAGPNWPAIIARVAAGIAQRAAAAGAGAAEAGAAATEAGAGAAEVEIGAGALSFETLIASGGVALGAMVIVGTLKTMIDGEEIRQLPKLVDKANRAFRLGFAAGLLGQKPPSDPLAKPAYELGQKNFQQSKKAALAKDPSISDKEIRQAIRSHLHQQEVWDMLWWKLHPFAQQAVWDAYGSENIGFVNKHIDSTTMKHAYVAIFGHLPSETDPNFTKYYMK